ncbi:ferritin-like domain-containing protein [Ectothiorhodospiraceae bacterium 2226]|nr:ferritin-like domain-containing protein [Ectothiorhodospiraceae bacterium 2226]
MDRRDVAERLVALAQLDIDAVHAYGQALEHVGDPDIHARLSEFRADHERHIESLTDLIRGLGERPPSLSRDFKGFFIEGFTALRSLSGTEGALEAMKTNESLTNHRYNDALAIPLPAEVRAVVQRNLADEERHLAYIEQALRERAWERAAPRVG